MEIHVVLFFCNRKFFCKQIFLVVGVYPKDGQPSITEFCNNHMSNQCRVVLFVGCVFQKMKEILELMAMLPNDICGDFVCKLLLLVHKMYFIYKELRQAILFMSKMDIFGYSTRKDMSLNLLSYQIKIMNQL